MMVGKMADVNIWNISLTMQDMVSWTNCESKNSGNVVKWEMDHWTLTGLNKEEIHDSCVCHNDGCILQVGSPVSFNGAKVVFD